MSNFYLYFFSVPIERFELSIVRVLRPLRMPIPPYGHFGWLMGFEPMLSVPQTDVLTANTINTICSSIRTRTLTFSSVVKGAIRYTIEPLLLPLSLSVVLPTFKLSELMWIDWFTISMSTPNLWWCTIIIPTTTSFRTNETIVPFHSHSLYSFFFHFTLGFVT